MFVLLYSAMTLTTGKYALLPVWLPAEAFNVIFLYFTLYNAMFFYGLFWTLHVEFTDWSKLFKCIWIRVLADLGWAQWFESSQALSLCASLSTVTCLFPFFSSGFVYLFHFIVIVAHGMYHNQCCLGLWLGNRLSVVFFQPEKPDRASQQTKRESLPPGSSSSRRVDLRSVGRNLAGGRRRLAYGHGRRDETQSQIAGQNFRGPLLGEAERVSSVTAV